MLGVRLGVQVRSVLLLVRARGGLSANERVQQLLSGPLFHLLHKQVLSGGPNVFSKVTVLEGDLQEPDLGLSESERLHVIREVDFVLHSAARVALEPTSRRHSGENLQ